MISDNQTSHASWLQLLIIFVIALLLFMTLRWQPEIWIASQINNYAKQHNVSISYKNLEVNGFVVDIEHLSIQTPQLARPINFDTLSLMPAWSSLLRATIGIHTQVIWREQHASATLIKRHDMISIQAFKVDMDVAELQPLLTKSIPLPVTFSGQIQARGNIQIHASDGRPLHGDITIQWRAATAVMASEQMLLGDYTLMLQTDNATTPWQWSIDGGSGLTLKGKGTINTAANNPAAWTTHGQLRLQASKETPSLAAMLGNKAQQFNISGNAFHPQILPL